MAVPACSRHWHAGCVLRRGPRSQASGQSFAPGSEISAIAAQGMAKALQGSSVALQNAGVEGGSSQPLWAALQPQEVTVTPGGTSQPGGHPSWGMGSSPSCENFSVNPMETDFPLSRLAVAPPSSSGLQDDHSFWGMRAGKG